MSLRADLRAPPRYAAVFDGFHRMEDAREQSTGTTNIASVGGSSDGPTRALCLDEPPVDERGGTDEDEVSVLVEGQRVGRYLVIEPIGSGGMSIVYAAYDPELDRRVALKVMRPDVDEQPDKAQARLLREAQAMARLAHPNVVRVYDVGLLERRVYMAMELVEGVTLREWLRAKARGWREVVNVMVRAGRGLDAAHRAGLVHLDVKPRNILVGYDGEVRVADFGLARAPRSLDSESSEGISSAADDAVTHAGMVMGTPGYMAPEQIGGSSDARSDQFSFCVTTWEALYGRRPYGGRRLDVYRGSLRAGQVVEPPPEARAPSRLRRLLERGLEITPEQRWPSMSPLLDALADDPRRRRVRTAAIVTLATMASAGAWTLGRGQADPCDEVDERLTEAWTEERREAVRARLTATGGAGPSVMADEVVGRLDDYAISWVTESTDACRAAQVEQRQSAELQDLRDYCLQHRLRALKATTDAILGSETDVKTSWRDAVLNLPVMAGCRDVTSVHEVGRPPADPQVRADADRLGAQLEYARAYIYAGRNEDAEALLRPLVAEAETLGHAPTIADAKLTLSEALLQLDRADEALELGLEGLWGADVAQLHPMRLDAAVDLTYNLGVLHGQFEEAERLARWALVIERELAPNPTTRSQIISHLGATHATAGDVETATKDYRRALRIRREAGLPADLNECSILTGLGATALLAGDPTAALSSFRDAHALFVAHYGADHPGALVVQENIATTLLGMERFGEALAEMEALLELAADTGSLERTSPTAEATHGAILLDLRRYAEATEVLERSRRGLESPLRRPVLLGAVRGNLALASIEQGRFEEGSAHAQAALDLLTPILPPSSFYVAWARTQKARAELAADRPLVALELAATAMDALETAEDPMAPDVRSDAALVLAHTLDHPEVRAEAEATTRWGGERTPAQWAARALAEARSGGRSAEPMLERAEAWTPRIARDDPR